MTNRKLKILFLCTGNSCRSQMAEGWARYLKSDCIKAYSAGTVALGQVNSYAIKAMQEAGVDISTHKSKSIDELADIKFDYVITVCDNAKQSCPVFPGDSKVVHFGFNDPPRLAAEFDSDAEKLAIYKAVCNEIKKFVQKLPDAIK